MKRFEDFKKDYVNHILQAEEYQNPREYVDLLINKETFVAELDKILRTYSVSLFFFEEHTKYNVYCCTFRDNLFGL